MGIRRFGSPEDVADFVANVFLEVLGSADRFDPRRGNAVDWLYGVAANVAGGMYRRQARTAIAERQLAGHAFLDADDYARVEEPSTRRTSSAAPTEHFSTCGGTTGACSN